MTPEAWFIQVDWGTDLYSALLPELGVNAARFEHLLHPHDPLLGQIATTLPKRSKAALQTGS